MIYKSLTTATVAAVLLLASCQGERKSKVSPDDYRNASLPIETRIESLISQMTLEEKIQQLAGHGLSTDSNARLGIPGLLMSDGPIGVRTGKATVFPAAVAVGASWDTLLIRQMAKVIATELKAKGLNMILGPCMDIQRFPAGGRNFETYSEDPFFNGKMAATYIRSAQEEGVIACAKHFACENIQWERFTLNQNIEVRTLKEIFFVPFEISVKEAQPLSVMASYYKINGVNATESDFFLNQTLKKDWGFKGLVVSDWDATHSTVEAAQAGLDVEMPQPVYFGEKLLAAVKEGKVSEQVIDEKVRRVLYAKFKAGLFDTTYQANPALVNTKEHQQLALKVAQSGIVLLKNQNNFLPLDKSKIKSIALIGPNAKVCRTSGGGSSQVEPFYTVSPYQGFEKYTQNTGIRLLYALGDKLDKDEVAPIPADYLYTDATRSQKGLKAEYFNDTTFNGKPAVTRIDPTINFHLLDGSPDPAVRTDMWAARWSGVLVSPAPMKFKISTFSDDGVRLYIDGKKVIENWDFHGMEKDSVEIFLDQNKPHDLVLEYFDGQMGADIKLTWDYNVSSAVTQNDNLLAEAVKVAKSADVSIVCVGLANFLESEARDVDKELRLPNNQEALIKAVSAANPNTLVVLNGGVALQATEWLQGVRGLIHGLYLGEQTGNALASVIFGEVSPSGKLPFTYIKSWKDSPTYEGYMQTKNLTFNDGVWVGYRYYDSKKVETLFPFGYGLSYTTFEYSNLKINSLGGNRYEVLYDVKNTGSRAGAESSQLYVSDVVSSLPRPARELKGFSKVQLAPGESKTNRILLDDMAFRYFDSAKNTWVIEPGAFEVQIGSNISDIRLKQTIELK